MTEPAAPDIAITGVVATPAVVGVNGTFDVNVTVFAPDEDFEDSVGFRLSCYVCPCGGDPPKDITPPSPLVGHVQEGFWTTPTATFTFKVTAGATPAIYNITAVLLEGIKGVPDPGDPPSVFCSDCSGSVIVV